MGGDAYCTPNIWESVCQGVSVLATRPRCGDGQGMTYLRLVRISGLWSEQTREKFGFDPFLSLQQACSRKHKGIRQRLWYQGSNSRALMGAASLSVSSPELRS